MKNRFLLLLGALALAAAPGCSGGPRDAPPPSSSPQPPVSPGGEALAPRGAGAAATPGAAVARAEGEFWAVTLEVPRSVRAGAPAEALLRVAARGGYHVNEEYPMSFRPAGDATARFPGERVGLSARTRASCREGGGACEVTAALPFVPLEPVEVRLAGTLAFSVCTAERCLIEKVPLASSAAVR